MTAVCELKHQNSLKTFSLKRPWKLFKQCEKQRCGTPLIIISGQCPKRASSMDKSEPRVNKGMTRFDVVKSYGQDGVVGRVIAAGIIGASALLYLNSHCAILLVEQQSSRLSDTQIVDSSSVIKLAKTARVCLLSFCDPIFCM